MVQRIIGVLLLVAASAFSEGGGAVSFDASALGASRLDLSEARFSFAAPCTFLVTGVVYDGMAYTALLEYDGERTLKVREAAAAPADAFSSLDLSQAFLAAAEGVVVLRNVLIDGYAYTLDVTQVGKSPAALSLAESAVSDVPVAAVQVVPSVAAAAREAAAVATATAATATANAATAAAAVAQATAATATATASTAAASAAKEAEAAAAVSAAKEAEAAAAVSAAKKAEAAAAASAAKEAEAAAKASAAARELEALKAVLAGKDREIAAWREKEASAAAAVAAAQQESLLSGFGAPASPLGAWSASETGLTQKDAALFFAKYPVAVTQSANEIVYRVSVQSLAPEGWVGGGIHLLASDAAAADGWGYGRSLLVWMTRDPRAYGDARTRLQLYFSSSPADMILLSDTVVAESLNDETAVEIAVRRDAGTVAVALGGERKILYTAPVPLSAGDRIALRTLGGPIRFAKLRVGTR